MKNLKDEVRDLEISKKKRDYDPEDETFVHDSDDSGSDEAADNDFDGREHYGRVGKSKLRRPVQQTLDSKYKAIPVSKSVLNDDDDDYSGDNDDDDPFAPVDEDEEDDPFAVRSNGEQDSESDDSGLESEPQDVQGIDGEVDEDEEIDSDEAFGEGDEEKFKGFSFRGSKTYVNGTSDTREDEVSVDESMSDSEDMEEDEQKSDVMSVDESDLDMSDIEDDLQSKSGSSSSSISSTTEGLTTNREKLKALARNQFADVAASLSSAASADLKKGIAVKQQRQAYDRLLDARIKLHKGLTASNELPSLEDISNGDAREALLKAQEAALTLWSTIDSIRCDILNQQQSPVTKTETTSKKRKRPLNPTRSTSTSDLWTHTQSLDRSSLPHSRAVLNKWSNKTRPATTTLTRSSLNPENNATKTTLTDVLDTYLSTNLDNLVSQSTSNNTTSLTPTNLTYDDTAFYQSLLRDLISSRTSTNLSNLSTIQPSTTGTLPTKLHSSTNKKRVDTKASKGRKIRYTVHEKLQNYMATEDRSTWDERARREFFGSLFGGQGGLLEDGGEDEEGNEGEEKGEEEEALRLFRS